MIHVAGATLAIGLGRNMSALHDHYILTRYTADTLMVATYTVDMVHTLAVRNDTTVAIILHTSSPQ